MKQKSFLIYSKNRTRTFRIYEQWSLKKNQINAKKNQSEDEIIQKDQDSQSNEEF